MSLKKSIFVFILILLMIQFFLKFVSKDYFLITEVEVNSDSQLLDEDITYKLEALKGANIWEIDTKVLENELLKDVRIQNIKITKQIPDKIIIDLKEEIPNYNVLHNQEMYLCNKNGKIYAFINENKMHDFIILRIKDHEQLGELFSVLKKVTDPKLQEIISEVYIKDSKNIVLLKDGTKINTNKSVTDEKYKNIFRLYSYLKQKNKKFEYIDLRFSDYIVK